MTNPASPEPATPPHEQGGGLLPCQKCHQQIGKMQRRAGFVVECPKCDGTWPTPAEAIAAWNRRASADLVEVLKEAREFVDAELCNRKACLPGEEDEEADGDADIREYVETARKVLAKIDAALSITGEGR